MLVYISYSVSLVYILVHDIHPTVHICLQTGKCANRLLGSSGLPLIAGQMKVYLRSVHLTF